MATMQVHPDSYYEDIAKRSIEEAMEECRDLPPDEQHFILRKSWPFPGELRHGRKYKIWNRLVAEQKGRLAIASRVHAKTKESLARNPVTAPPAPPDTAAEFLKQNPCPQTKEQASRFLRKHTLYSDYA